MSVFWEQLCSRLNIILRPSSAFHHQTNGQTDRMNGTIKQVLRVAQYQDRNWLDVLEVSNAPLVETDFSTYYLTYGYHNTLCHDIPGFTGAKRRMKELPRQFLARLLADWNHVSEILRKNQDWHVQRSSKHVNAHRFHV